jgi:hypothetical protein
MTRPVCRDVTVVIPTTGGEVLHGCLSSISAGTTWPQELIVVDQGRRADVAAWIAELRDDGLNARHLPSSQSGIAAATNRGLEQVRTPFVAITHDDCRVRRDWLARLTARLPEVGDRVVTGGVEPTGDGIVLTVKLADEPAIYDTPLIDADVLFPPNMGFPVRLIERVGAFDEHRSLLTAGEDNDWHTGRCVAGSRWSTTRRSPSGILPGSPPRTCRPSTAGTPAVKGRSTASTCGRATASSPDGRCATSSARHGYCSAGWRPGTRSSSRWEREK